jgi:hypothetical protein
VNELRYDGDDATADSWAPQLRVGAFSLLLPLVLGFTVLVLWIWLGGFGIVLGLILDVVAVAWWRGKRGQVIPADPTPADLIKVLVVTIVLGGIAVLANVG